MKSLLKIKLIILVLIKLLLISNYTFPKSNNQGKNTYSITWNHGYRLDQFRWNISGNGVNILSELTWEDLQIYQTDIKSYIQFDNKIYLKASIGFGFILEGKNQDSDYDGNNRTAEFSRSNNKADKGYVIDISIGGGYLFSIIEDTLNIIPLVGLSYNRLSLRITDGYQTIATPGRTPDVGPFDGLNSKYHANWFSLWFGTDIDYKINTFKMKTGIEFHGLYYFASADWNLRDNFQHPTSFEHFANGLGLDVFVSIGLNLSKSWLINFDYYFKQYFTFPGTMKTYLSDGSTSEGALNEVDWWSHKFMLGLTYSF